MKPLVEKIVEVFECKPIVKENGDVHFSVRCPSHPDRNPSLSLIIKNDGRVIAKCFTGCCPAVIYNDLRKLGIFTPTTKEYGDILKIIERTRPLTKGSPLYQYIKNRDLNPDLPHATTNLRESFLPHSESGTKKHCLVGVAINSDNIVTGIQRTFVEETGIKVSESPKKMLGSTKGSAVHIGIQYPQELHLTEGIENAMAVHEATGKGVSAVLSASNLSNQFISKDIKRIHIWADNDKSKTGQREAFKALKKYSIENPDAEICLHLPKKNDDQKKSVDWLDIFNESGGMKIIAEEYLNSLPTTIETAEETLLDTPIIPQIKEIATPELPLESIPTPLRNFSIDVGERLGVPNEAVLIPLLAIISSLLGNKICVYPKKLDTSYKVFPNLWGWLVGNPSTKKSPSMKSSIQIIEELQTMKTNSFNESIRYIKPKIQVSENQKTKTLKAIEKNGPSDLLMKELFRIEDELTEYKNQLKMPKYIINDATPEKILELSQHSKHGFLIFRDEASGLLNEFEKPGREGYRQLLLEGWTGNGFFSMDRKISESCSAKICFSIFGSIQPDIIKKLIKKSHDLNDGFIQRVQLLIYLPEFKVFEGIDRMPNESFKISIMNFLTKLLEAKEGELGSKRNNDSAYGFTFSNEAYEILRAYKTEMRVKSLREENLLFKGHLDKMDKLICSLSAIFHLANDEQGSIISTTTLSSSLEVVNFLIKHAEIIYKVLPSQLSNSGLLLLRKIKSGEVLNGASKRSIVRHGWSGLGRDDLDCAIDELSSLHWLSVDKNSSHIGRPSDILIFSPLLPKYIHLII